MSSRKEQDIFFAIRTLNKASRSPLTDLDDLISTLIYLIELARETKQKITEGNNNGVFSDPSDYK